MSPLPQLKYRADIDGLRAVAVLCVIGFHAFPRSLPGGFIGVDIFFVISGYLISGIIFGALQQGRFSYADFYARRIRRIFPALLTVLLVGLILGWFLLLPDDYKALGQQTLAGTGFASNLLLWEQAGILGYFDVSSQVNPLLHLWSLGIEEQFYLTWPLIAALLYRRSRHLLWTIGGLFVASFALNIALSHGSQTTDFYLPLSRFWELLIGAGLAYAGISTGNGLNSTPAIRSGYRSAMAWCGLLLLATALTLINQARAFPGWWALLPTIGTVLIIAARDAWLNRVVLSNRMFVFVGVISYPLYLWHWVLLALLRAQLFEDGAEAPRLQRLAVVALSFLLAWLTYLFIEKPIRFSLRTVLRPAMLVAMMAGVGVLGAVVYASDGAAFRYPAAIRPLAGLQYAVERDRHAALYRSRKCFLDIDQSFADIAPECMESPDAGKPLMVLWGDSHAASLYPGIKMMQEQVGNFRLDQFTAAGCPPVDTQPLATDAILPRCRQFAAAALAKIIALRPDIVLLEGDWWVYCMGTGSPDRQMVAALQSVVRRLKSAGVSRVVVFGSLPVWDMAQPKVAVEVWLQSGTLQQRTHLYFRQDSVTADTLIREAMAQTDAVFVSPIDQLCDERGCLLSAQKESIVPVAWDSAHLSLAGSQLLVGATFGQVLDPLPPRRDVAALTLQ